MNLFESFIYRIVVRRGGVEPPHPKAQRPQRCVSTIPPPAHIKSGLKMSDSKESN